MGDGLWQSELYQKSGFPVMRYTCKHQLQLMLPCQDVVSDQSHLWVPWLNFHPFMAAVLHSRGLWSQINRAGVFAWPRLGHAWKQLWEILDWSTPIFSLPWLGDKSVFACFSEVESRLPIAPLLIPVAFQPVKKSPRLVVPNMWFKLLTSHGRSLQMYSPFSSEYSPLGTGPNMIVFHSYPVSCGPFLQIWLYIWVLLPVCSQFSVKIAPENCSPAKKQSFSNFMVSVNISSDFRAQEEDICHCFQLFSCYLTWSDGTGCHDLSFLFVCFTFQYWVLRQFFFSPSSRGSLVLLCFLPIKWYHSHIWISWYFSWQSWFQLVTHPAWHFSWCALCLS